MVTIRTRLFEKLRGKLKVLRQAGTCPPQAASEVVGLLGFMAVGTPSRLLRAAQSAFRRRMRGDGPTGPAGRWAWTPDLERGAALAEVVVNGVSFSRDVWLSPSQYARLAVASDARADDSAPPSLAVVVVDPVSGERWGIFASIPAALLALWGDPAALILVVEAVAPLLGLLARPGAFRGRDALWFIDNTGALAAHSAGGSREWATDRTAAVTAMVAHWLGFRAWWEFVASADNWADPPSRDGPSCAFCAARDIPIFEVPAAAWPWQSHDLAGLLAQAQVAAGT
jgi:hypothetical protein